jgi:hypothetical protein
MLDTSTCSSAMRASNIINKCLSRVKADKGFRTISPYRTTPVQLIAVLIDDRAERDRDVTERDRDITPDVRVPRRLQDAEEQVMVCVAELRAHAEELAKRERRHRPQRRVLSKMFWLVLRGEMLEIYKP